VLTQVVPRERLVQAHARNALASSGAEVAGPGLAGVLVKLLGAPLALLCDALLLFGSALLLRGIRVDEAPPSPSASDIGRDFMQELRRGLQFVRGQRLLVALAWTVGAWQLCQNAALVVQILHASRGLGLREQVIGLCFVALGVGTLTASLLADRLSERVGPGPSLVLGCALCGTGWLLPWLWPTGGAGVAAFVAMLLLAGGGGLLMFVNFLALRQAVTPAPLLGRMTATMRWLILLPAAPGALLGGWIGEHVCLTATLGAAGGCALVLAALAWGSPLIRGLRMLPAVAEVAGQDGRAGVA
jgi:predicted MFS family arabinose efflux permease